MSAEKEQKIGKWLNISGQNFTENSKCFVYLVDFVELGKKYIGYKAVVSRKNKKPVSWEMYKTSSKLVRGLLRDGWEPIWYIIKIFDDFDEGYAYERSQLVERDVLGDNKNEYLNQCIGQHKMSRLPESYTEEAINAAKEGLIRHMQSEDYQHPMLGKQHPNRGKKLPQTAPKVHVSVNNIQITNGVVNKWHPKGEEIPEGFRKGIKISTKRTPEEIEAFVRKAREIQARNYRARVDEYNLKPNACIVCGCDLEYERRKLKSCSDFCNSKNRSRISKSIEFSDDSIQAGVSKRLDNLALTKGFDNYLAMCNHVVELCKLHTIKQVSVMVGLSVTGVQGCMRFVDFSLREYRKLQRSKEI